MRSIRKCVSFAAVAVACLTTAVAEEVLVRTAADGIRLSAPNFRFLTGKPLERLKNGGAVAFDVQVSVLGEGKQYVLRRSFERFVFSYDLWEERFSVTRMRSTRASASHMTAAAAEAWCLEKFVVSPAGLPQDRPLWFRVEVRPQENREPAPADDNEGGFSLGSLIDVFSRPARSRGPTHLRAESAPVRLADLNGSRSLAR